MHCSVVHCIAACCSAAPLPPQGVAGSCSVLQWRQPKTVLVAAIHCNTLQDFFSGYNTLQHTATRCNTLQHAATRCNSELWHLHQRKKISKFSSLPKFFVLQWRPLQQTTTAQAVVVMHCNRELQHLHQRTAKTILKIQLYTQIVSRLQNDSNTSVKGTQKKNLKNQLYTQIDSAKSLKK